jgi:uncharacterized repeat protein (TIGR03803 family)
MKHNRILPMIPLALVAIALALTTIAHAQDTETILYTFDGTHGSGPGSLIEDSAGNFYGTTQFGGNPANCSPVGCGVIFKISHSTGSWVETVIHAFSGGTDGYFPISIVIDAEGNIFGVAEEGGANGYGVTFKLTPNAGGWGFKVLHSFPSSATDGTYPDALILDADGNVYGAAAGDAVTTRCPASGSGCGLIYKLSPTQNGPWNETVLHRFTGAPRDGNGPAALLFDSAGNIDGVAGSGGAACPNNINIGCGVVYQLSPTSSGPWTETLLHTFNGTDGSAPHSLVIDPAGNLFGTTFEGGISGCNTGTCGLVFGLSPNSGGWTETTIHKFNGAGNGNFPYTVVLDQLGNLYSAGSFAGPFSSGTVIELSPGSGGTWSQNLLFDFPLTTDGAYPVALVVDSSGNFYGAAFGGGDSKDNGNGLIFQLTP